MTIADLPAINATLNAIATSFLVAGFVSIKRGNKRAHIGCMVAALTVSVAFLTCYTIYHYQAEAMTKFAHEGWPKAVYLIVLFTHIPLAALTVPLVLLTVIPALRQRFDRHKRLARWTFPVWLYVSVTGVLVYLMLYRWFPAP